MTPQHHAAPTVRTIPTELYDRIVPMLQYLQTRDVLSSDDKTMLFFVRGDILEKSRIIPNPELP